MRAAQHCRTLRSAGRTNLDAAGNAFAGLGWIECAVDHVLHLECCLDCIGSTADNYLVAAGIKINHIIWRTPADAQPLALADGVVPKTAVYAEYLAVKIDDFALALVRADKFIAIAGIEILAVGALGAPSRAQARESPPW